MELVLIYLLLFIKDIIFYIIFLNIIEFNNRSFLKYYNQFKVNFRFDNLHINYIKKCLINKNPIIEDSYQEYLQFTYRLVLGI